MRIGNYDYIKAIQAAKIMDLTTPELNTLIVEENLPAYKIGELQGYYVILHEAQEWYKKHIAKESAEQWAKDRGYLDTDELCDRMALSVRELNKMLESPGFPREDYEGQRFYDYEKVENYMVSLVSPTIYTVADVTPVSAPTEAIQPVKKPYNKWLDEDYVNMIKEKCKAKKVYHSMEEAEQAVVAQPEVPLDAFKCQVGDHWHVGKNIHQANNIAL